MLCSSEVITFTQELGAHDQFHEIRSMVKNQDRKLFKATHDSVMTWIDNLETRPALCRSLLYYHGMGICKFIHTKGKSGRRTNMSAGDLCGSDTVR